MVVVGAFGAKKALLVVVVGAFAARRALLVVVVGALGARVVVAVMLLGAGQAELAVEGQERGNSFQRNSYPHWPELRMGAVLMEPEEGPGMAMEALLRAVGESAAELEVSPVRLEVVTVVGQVQLAQRAS